MGPTGSITEPAPCVVERQSFDGKSLDSRSDGCRRQSAFRSLSTCPSLACGFTEFIGLIFRGIFGKIVKKRSSVWPNTRKVDVSFKFDRIKAIGPGAAKVLAIMMSVSTAFAIVGTPILAGDGSLAGRLALASPAAFQSDEPMGSGVDSASELYAGQPERSELIDRINNLELRLWELEHGSEEIQDPSVASSAATHSVQYDAGWKLAPNDVDATPFQMRVGLHNQFRYTNFQADQPTFTNAAGDTIDIRDRNDFDINRGRLVFDGFAFHEDLGYYVNIDYNTVSSSPIQLLLSWISFDFCDALKLHAGLGKVPGSWEWQQSSRYPMGIERTLATTFFRPSISAGVWATGSFYDSIFHRTMVSDGFNTFSLRAAELDTNFAYSTLWWWEPLESFGDGFSDVEMHDTPAIRIGHGLTQNSNDETFADSPGPEQTVVRLTDGTRLVSEGALAAGETVGSFDQWLYTVHAGVKWRGWSVSGEGFFRWLRNIKSVDDDDLGSLFATGFYAQASKFVFPKRLELYSRTSHVDGKFGHGREISAGLNWYLFESRSARATFEVADLRDSPAEQSRTAFVAGGSGTLIQAQLWTFF